MTAETFTRWVKDVVHPALPEGALGRKHVHCPNPGHPDHNPSFRVSLDRDNETGIPLCTCDNDLNWHTVAGWLRVQSYDDYKGNGAVAQVSTTKQRYTTLDDYAKAHGVDGALFAKAGWSQVDDDMQQHMVYCSKHEIKRPAFLFPTDCGMKARFIDDLRPTFRPVEKGYQACWYGLKRALSMSNGKRDLVWCNGEPSVIVAQHFGIPAIATTGGEGNKFAELVRELEYAKTIGLGIWIVMDCDTAGKRAAKKAADALTGMGYTNFKTITLPLSDKGDLADFCKLHGNGTIAELIKLADSKPKPEAEQTSSIEIKPSLIKLGDTTGRIASRLLQNLADPGGMRGLSFGLRMVDGMTRGMRDGNVLTILGAAGMGKSTWMAGVAGAFMEQAPGYLEPTELGEELFTIKLACSIARVPFTKFDDGDMNPGEVAAFEQALDLINRRTIIAPSETSTPDQLKRRIQQAQQEHGIKWVMIDSLNKLSINADNYYGEITTASGAIQNVAKELNLPIIVSSQTGRKAVDRSDKRPRTNDGKGSGQIEEDAAVLLGIYYHEYYVKRGEAKPDKRFPPGIAMLYNLKDRWRGMEGAEIPLKFIGGAAFTDISKEDYARALQMHRLTFDDDDESDD